MSDYIVITGLSGAGRSSAANAFEDLGWFVIDNLPPILITKVTELVQLPGTETSKVVLAVGIGEFFDELVPALETLRDTANSMRMLFLEAADDVLVRRYEGTRRRHPLDEHGLVDAIREERELLTPVKAMADVVIDTTDLNVHQLRDRVIELFAHDDTESGMRTAVLSFGYKHGIPLDADIVLDCRFLPNPHWEPELRPMTGLDAPVRDFVVSQPETDDFLNHIDGLLDVLLPAFVKEGKSYLTIAVGCTGGRHRSVALAEEIGKRIGAKGIIPSISHRDITKQN